jgi:hypothetical protein
MQDAIHEADSLRTNIILISMIPFFYLHSILSKYITECIDYILKTEITLPPYIALWWCRKGPTIYTLKLRGIGELK